MCWVPDWHRVCSQIRVKNLRNLSLLALAVLALSPASQAATTNLPPAPIKEYWGGGRHTMALLSDGTVWTWGSDVDGKLGDNQSCSNYNDATYDSHLPLKVHGPGNVGYLTNIVATSAGEGHNLALKIDGTVWAWGYIQSPTLSPCRFRISATAAMWFRFKRPTGTVWRSAPMARSGDGDQTITGNWATIPRTMRGVPDWSCGRW